MALFLPDEKIWADERVSGEEYFATQGINNIFWISGIHAFKWGIEGVRINLLKDPKLQERVPAHKVGGYLSYYQMFNTLLALPDQHCFILETDARFVDGWKEKLEQALLDVPADFDFFFVGSCCAQDKNPRHVKGDVYEFPYLGPEKWDYYPQCGHCLIINKKCLPFIISKLRDTGYPVDIALIKFCFPELKIYAILPRLADQGTKTHLPL